MKTMFLVLTLGAVLASPVFAQTADSTNAPPPGPPPGGPGGFHHGMGFLTEAEKAELKKAHDAAIAADPSLATEEQTLKEQMKAAFEAGTPPTADQIAAWHAFREKMDAAMISADPAVAPILAKIKSHHHGPGGFGGGKGGPDGGDGPPPPPPAN